MRAVRFARLGWYTAKAGYSVLMPEYRGLPTAAAN